VSYWDDIADHQSDFVVTMGLQPIVLDTEYDNLGVTRKNLSRHWLRYTASILHEFGKAQQPTDADVLHAPAYLVTQYNGVQVMVIATELQLGEIPPRNVSNNQTGFRPLSEDQSWMGYAALVFDKNNAQHTDVYDN
jgi:hypothetical protein